MAREIKPNQEYLGRLLKLIPSEIIAAYSFVVWVYSLGGWFVLWNIHQPWISSAVLLLWTTFIPQLFKTKEE